MRLERIDGVALLRMDAGKANAISPEFLAALNKLLDELDRSDANAVVVTGSGNAFSAGLALPMLIELDRPAITAFIESFNRTMVRLFDVRQPMVAAVNGHAIAGGCVIATQADFRFITDAPCKIGLNEVPLGIGLPTVVVETLRCQVPPASLLPIAIEGRLLAPAEALALGLVHEVVPAEKLLERAIEKARELAALPAAAVRQVKASLRGRVSAQVHAASDADTARWVDTWFTSEGQQRIRAAVARLKRS
jgi:enoyl-CoA hydratase